MTYAHEVTGDDGKKTHILFQHGAPSVESLEFIPGTKDKPRDIQHFSEGANEVFARGIASWKHGIGEIEAGRGNAFTDKGIRPGEDLINMAEPTDGGRGPKYLAHLNPFDPKTSEGKERKALLERISRDPKNINQISDSGLKAAIQKAIPHQQRANELTARSVVVTKNSRPELPLKPIYNLEGITDQKEIKRLKNLNVANKNENLKIEKHNSQKGNPMKLHDELAKRQVELGASTIVNGHTPQGPGAVVSTNKNYKAAIVGVDNTYAPHQSALIITGKGIAHVQSKVALEGKTHDMHLSTDLKNPRSGAVGAKVSATGPYGQKYSVIGTVRTENEKGALEERHVLYRSTFHYNEGRPNFTSETRLSTKEESAKIKNKAAKREREAKLHQQREDELKVAHKRGQLKKQIFGMPVAKNPFLIQTAPKKQLANTLPPRPHTSAGSAGRTPVGRKK